MLQNTATNRRRHSAVTARSWAEVTGEAATLRKFPHLISGCRDPCTTPATRPKEAETAAMRSTIASDSKTPDRRCPTSGPLPAPTGAHLLPTRLRSEEHTSELQ